MGGHPWMYFVPYEDELQAALDKLKAREFRAGRYNPVLDMLPFPVDPDGPAPGARHRSIAHALKAADAEGTRSILDMDRVGNTPRAPRPSQQQVMKAMEEARKAGRVIDFGSFMPSPDEYGVVTPVSEKVLKKLYGTSKPSRAAVLKKPELLDEVDRGMGVYVIVYARSARSEICFAGYSFD